MNNLKKTLLITISIFLLSSNSFAQSRENRLNITFKSTSEKLTSAIGWKLNKTTGKWIDNKNVIDDRVSPPYAKSYIAQNINWIQFGTIHHNENVFYVMIFERLDGKYKYENIQQDWEPETQTHFLVFDSAEYTKLVNVVNNKEGKEIIVSSKRFGFTTDKFQILGGEHLYNEENLLAKITGTLEKAGYSEMCFIINSQKANDFDVVRFKLPLSSYSLDKNLLEAYFEVGTNEFSKLLIK